MPTAQVAIRLVQTPLADYQGVDPNLNNQVSSFATAASTIRWCRLENGGGSQALHMKLYDTSASPTIGTTAPALILPCNAGKITELLCKEGLSVASGIQACCVAEPGTAGTTAPSVAATGRVNFS